MAYQEVLYERRLKVHRTAEGIDIIDMPLDQLGQLCFIKSRE